jgi:hypothetical protein
MGAMSQAFLLQGCETVSRPILSRPSGAYVLRLRNVYDFKLTSGALGK